MHAKRIAHNVRPLVQRKECQEYRPKFVQTHMTEECSSVFDSHSTGFEWVRVSRPGVMSAQKHTQREVRCNELETMWPQIAVKTCRPIALRECRNVGCSLSRSTSPLQACCGTCAHHSPSRLRLADAECSASPRPTTTGSALWACSAAAAAASAAAVVGCRCDCCCCAPRGPMDGCCEPWLWLRLLTEATSACSRLACVATGT